MKDTIMNLEEQIERQVKEIDFSGAISIQKEKGALLEAAYGYANRAEQRLNRFDTRFGIASGCKIFTSIEICRLVEEGRLTFDTRLSATLNVNFPLFDRDITIHHLLTHTSGIPDYFDEETMEDFSELWKERPMYRMEDLKDFLPMFQNDQMKFRPGERFHYNNAGYILLGLVIEELTGKRFRDYLKEELFDRIGMNDSGYFFLDQLPANTAFGYLSENRTNIYSLPIVGGSDGGAFTTAYDMATFWKALIENKILSETMKEQLLTPHVKVEDDVFYGYGVWIKKKDDQVGKYHVMGYDPGVSFHSGYYPDNGITITVLSNKSKGAYQILLKLEEMMIDEV